MTRKILREGRLLADVTYEIEQIEIKKAKLQSQLIFSHDASGTVPKDKKMLQEWSSLCKIRMTLLAKQDFQKQSLYSFSFTTPGDQGQAGQHNYGKVCDHELAALTDGGISKIVTSVTKVDPKTGRTVQDQCAMCMAVYDNAKCLTTQNGKLNP